MVFREFNWKHMASVGGELHKVLKGKKAISYEGFVVGDVQDGSCSGWGGEEL